MRYTDIIDDAVKRISELWNDDLISHFIICGSFKGYWKYNVDRTTFKEILLSQMKKYGMESAFLTILDFGRLKLKTKKAADYYYYIYTGK